MHTDLVDLLKNLMLSVRVEMVFTYSHLGKWGLSSSRVINQNMAMNHIADK